MSLAIVIPAYKGQYLEAALMSISNQTDKDFIVYIGDDYSPYHLFEIITRFDKTLNIVYRKFDENLGLSNLTLHWDRCIAMTKNEDWIWLFSDDDLMDKNCVSAFKNALASTNSQYDLYRFNTKIINSEGQLQQSNALHPQTESAYEFAIERLNLNRNSYVVEYIFSKQKYLNSGKFVSFPLAWNSDDATWITIASDKGIFTIADAFVAWRYSFTNISSIQGFVDEKIEASIQYLNWLKNWIIKHSPSSKYFNGYEKGKLMWLKQQVRLSNKHFSMSESLRLSKTFNQHLAIPIQASLLFFIHLNYTRLKHKLKSKIHRFIKGSIN
jgi:glycosyltransferase involved in cell wall biosynthesis